MTLSLAYFLHPVDVGLIKNIKVILRTDIQGGQIEAVAKEGKYTQVEMARELRVNQSTISRELRPGRTRQMRSNHTDYDCYLTDAGARVYRKNRKHSRPRDPHKYSEKFLRKLPKVIKSTLDKPRIHSVVTFVHTYRRNHPDERVPCTKTVYNLIDQGVLPIKNIDLPIKTRMRPRRKHPSEAIGANTKDLGPGIEERDPAVLERKEPGHWEVDLMMGKRAKTEPVIITMIER